MTMINRYKAVLALLILLSAATIAGAQTSTADGKQLMALLTEFLDGASRNDAAIHDRFWSEDLIYTRSAGARIDKAELMKGVRSAEPRKPNDAAPLFSAEGVMIRLYGKTAIVAFKLISKSTASPESIAEYLNTGTFVKKNGKWQAVAWQSTPIPKATPHADPPARTAGRSYQTGPRGGCFYVDGSGKKVYVKKDLCTQK